MGIRVYTSKDTIGYAYKKIGCYAMQMANNISATSFSGQSLNNIKSQITSVKRLDEKILSLSSYAFANCPKISSVAFNDTLLSVGSFCFKNCVSLVTARYPCSLREIGEGAFVGCRNLKRLDQKWFHDDSSEIDTDCTLK